MAESKAPAKKKSPRKKRTKKKSPAQGRTFSLNVRLLFAAFVVALGFGSVLLFSALTGSRAPAPSAVRDAMRSAPELLGELAPPNGAARDGQARQSRPEPPRELPARPVADEKTADQGEPAREEGPNTLRQGVSTDWTYVEEPGKGLPSLVRRVDDALLATLYSLGMETSRLGILDVRTERSPEGDFHYQAIAIELNVTARRFTQALEANLRPLGSEVSLSSAGGNERLVIAHGFTTHRIILLEPDREIRERRSIPDDAKGVMAVVIDDMGQDFRVAKALAALDAPITFAVLPYNPNAERTARLGRDKGLDVILHQPTEPESYPGTNPGPGALFVGMGAEKIRAIVRENLRRVPGAIGSNNHMGSRFTAWPEGMRAYLAELKAHRMFFLDSVTTDHSAGSAEARRLCLPFYSRNVFLDNARDVNAILLQLKKAERLALSTGQSIAIGHEHPGIVRALERWLKEKDPRVAVVPISSLPAKNAQADCRN